MVELFEKDAARNDRKEVENSLARRLSARASRQLLSRNESKKVDARMGLSFLGAIGWHVPVPTVLGALLGQWLDEKYPHGSVSWALNLMLVGLAIGMFSTWVWVRREGIDHALKEQKERGEQIALMQEEAGVEPEEAGTAAEVEVLPGTDKIIGEKVIDD